MKYVVRIIIFIGMIVYAGNCAFAGVPNIFWIKTFRDTGVDAGYCVHQLKDDGYIVGGTSQYSGKDNFYIIRTDKNGDTIWTRTYDGAGTHCFIEKTQDEGFLLVGGGGDKTYLIRIDSLGDTLWTKAYNWAYGQCACQTSDKGFMIITYLKFPIKVDSLGDTLWTKYFWEIASAIFIIQQVEEGGFIMIGENQITGNQLDGALIRIDDNGDTLWTKTYGGTSWDVFTSGTQTSDSGFIMTGYTDMNAPNDNDDIWLLKTDKNGNKMWDKTFGGLLYDHGYWVEETFDKGFIITGSTESYGAGSMSIWLIKTDENGNKMWDTTFSDVSTNFAIGECVKQTSDSGFILTGTKDGNIMLIKTGKEIAAEEGIPPKKEYQICQSIPNPFSQQTTIEFAYTKDKNIILKIYDLSGKLIKNFNIICNCNSQNYKVIWDGTNNKGEKMENGIYFYRIEANNYKISGKLQLLRKK